MGRIGSEASSRSRFGFAALPGALAVVLLAAFSLRAGFDLGGDDVAAFFGFYIYEGLILGAAVACGVRAVTARAERGAWALMGFGILLWGAGSVSFEVLSATLDVVPIPSVADVFWLPAYPVMYAALVLLVRSRLPGCDRSLWLDGVIASLAIGAAAAALALESIMNTTAGSFGVVAAGLAYVAVDLVLLILVTAVFGLSGWRPGRAWLLLGVGLLTLCTADYVYLFQSAEGTYVNDGLLDALWPAAFLMVAFAAWQPPVGAAAREVRGLLRAVVPALATITAVSLLAYDHFNRITTVAIVLATGTLVVASVRLFLAFVENQRLLASSREEALKDSLTGLSNRRSLMRDLEEAIDRARPDAPLALVLLDLNGFKGYNDTFGHPAGDQLLARLGARFEQAMGSLGSAYRLGGDEFCALIPAGETGTDTETIAACAAAALSDEGKGFSIDSSRGLVLVPTEAEDVEGSLALADRRMYAAKGAGRSSASRQTRDVLMKALAERGPELHTHVEQVAELSKTVARRLGMPAEAIDEVARAAELHDIGKVAIPDAILNKPGPLSPREWEFMERHTIIGERILGAAPALGPVARIVRSTHERFDGTGYPDNLAAESIPLGARIVSVCDAYNAMTSSRPYSKALPPKVALAELRRCAGIQFDPRVVEAFCAVVTGTGEELTASLPILGAGARVDRPRRSPSVVSRGQADNRPGPESGALLE